MSWRSAGDILNAMIDEFQKSTINLLQISKRDLREFDNGQYGVVIAKLSRRLESVLSVDREILVIFSNFTHQQARTIRFARKTITDEGVRLEPTLAIIVHKDPRGNEKLRNWGRQDGLTVLPIQFKGSLPSDEALERVLCIELFSHDLFDITGPVSDDSQFYGRRTEAEELARKLQLGQIRACLGLRKIGKTSIINRVINQLRLHHDAISVMVDCSKDAISSLDASGLMWSIAESVREAINKDSNYIAVSPRKGGKSVSEGSESILRAISSSERVIIIFMDEVDYITPSSPTAANLWKTDFNVFWRNFRSVYQELTRSKRPNMSLLISGVSSKWFSVHAIDDVENAALSLIPEEYLSPLPRGASLAMIREMSRASGLILGGDVREKIAKVSADIPFWIRKACSFIHRHIPIEDRPYKPTLSSVDDFLHKFVDSEGAVLARLALGHLFTVYPELEEGVYNCYEGNSSDCAKPVLDRLRKYGIITRGQTTDILSGDMIHAGFEAHLEERTAAPRSILPSHASNSLEDWADDLAVLNKKRNVLEKRLRDVTLNFLRYDSLHNKSKGEIHDRLLTALDPRRRDHLKRKSNEEIVTGFNWSELVILINKEWNLFDPIFSDKRRFNDDCEIINDRRDAHAKPMDRADFALYRRSLDRITDLLNKKT